MRQSVRKVLHPIPSPLTRAEKLHITLVYLGEVSNETLQVATRIAASLEASSFELQLTQLNYWPNSGIYWLGDKEIQVDLLNLRNQLYQPLMNEGLKPDKQAFIPHVTIARSRKAIQVPIDLLPMSWSVKDFVLIKSTDKAGESHYQVMETFPLRGKS
jgi:2'-5' RNA ligase